MATMFGGIAIGWEVEAAAACVRLTIDASCVGTGYLTPSVAREMAKALLQATARAERVGIAARNDRCRCTVSDRGVEACRCGKSLCPRYVESEFPDAKRGRGRKCRNRKPAQAALEGGGPVGSLSGTEATGCTAAPYSAN